MWLVGFVPLRYFIRGATNAFAGSSFSCWRCGCDPVWCTWCISSGGGEVVYLLVADFAPGMHTDYFTVRLDTTYDICSRVIRADGVDVIVGILGIET